MIPLSFLITIEQQLDLNSSLTSLRGELIGSEPKLIQFSELGGVLMVRNSPLGGSDGFRVPQFGGPERNLSGSHKSHPFGLREKSNALHALHIRLTNSTFRILVRVYLEAFQICNAGLGKGT